ncbi:MAG TPA: FprA family A-type flavoprotein [Bacteroidales bacterium]|nr:FprA family A-type flavoprotein [Bacteroidales bacterium]HCI56404.1 MBL fold hydrolase [Bacteroidales bacterium]HOU96504.1 FprA family A-type flavoprotein [Bacteroidales bacterium]HQG36882.1 FprA family A-type flavoprotein [Bacteroidales bacterium]HQG53458.1 FprA family A-type flavoprotein [Bacteroidales bacterium]
MAVREIKDNIFAVGVKDWDRRLFDELIPLPDGTSYNSYLIKGSQKIALIDASDPGKRDELLDNLKESGINRIDYLVANHAEQDHSGAIPDVLNLYPGAKVVTNEKCRNMLADLLLISEDRFITIQDGETLSLGDKTLKFIIAPWVHWPETMVTYLAEDKILFSCDLFGSHLAVSDLYVNDECKVYESAKRYYAEIMMPFRSIIKKNLEKLANYEIKIIAPSHGPVYQNAGFIINAYKDWISDNVKNEVVLPFVSMHHSTRKMVDYLISGLIKRNITVKPFNLTETDIGELAMSLVDASTIVIGTPTVLTGPHPQVVYAAYLANALKPKLKYASVIGSYGWGGRTLDIIKGLITNLNVELIEPVMIKGYPKENDFKLLDKLADEIVEKHKK